MDREDEERSVSAQDRDLSRHRGPYTGQSSSALYPYAGQVHSHSGLAAPRSGGSTPRSISSLKEHPLTGVYSQLASTGARHSRSEAVATAAVDNYDLYLSASEETHRVRKEAERQIAVVAKERDGLKDELRRALKTAADAVESRDDIMARSKVDTERCRRKQAQVEEYAAELEKQLRAERKQKSSLQSELKTASDYSQVAEESMSQTIDKQHTKNLDLLHALATVSQHYQNRRAGDSDGTNPAD